MVKVFFDNLKKVENNKIVVPVYVDTEGKNINAFELRLKLDDIIFRDYLDKDSIIVFWLEKPYLDKNVLVFSGIIPGGYTGKNGLLTKLIFEYRDGAKIEVLPSSQFLLADGLGTKAKIEVTSFNLPYLGKLDNFVLEDRHPPERFKIYVTRDKNMFGGRYYITFETKDKQSGIAYYQVRELTFLPYSKMENFHFENVKPPYVLKDQTLRSYVVVKAVDKFGNERIEILKPQRKILVDEIILLLLFGILIFIFFNLFYNKRKNLFKRK
ncbi:MAG: hypothetical protein NZ822_01760 [Patescibacteria group bacterium]|nr:hypothetical protein [Patescibacteria group bacterium]